MMSECTQNNQKLICYYERLIGRKNDRILRELLDVFRDLHDAAKQRLSPNAIHFFDSRSESIRKRDNEAAHEFSEDEFAEAILMFDKPAAKGYFTELFRILYGKDPVVADRGSIWD